MLSNSDNLSNKKFSAYSYLNLVKANKSDFNKSQLRRAGLMRGFRKRFGYPGYQKYFKILEKQYFRNFPLTVDDAKR